MLEQFENGRATLIAALEDIRDGRIPGITYSQYAYGTPGPAGHITGCLACIALCLEQGVATTYRELAACMGAKNFHEVYSIYASHVLEAAKNLLGLSHTEQYDIFGTGCTWPDDLQVLYGNNRIEAAIQALNRLQPDGSIAESELPTIPAEPVRDSLLEEVLA